MMCARTGAMSLFVCLHLALQACGSCEPVSLIRSPEPNAAFEEAAPEVAPSALARITAVNGRIVAVEAPAIAPLDEVSLSGSDSFTPVLGRWVQHYHWKLVDRPEESRAVLTHPHSALTGFRFDSSGLGIMGLDVAGTYVVALTVADSAGVVSVEEALISFTAVPAEELHVQLTWSHARADIDLHLVRDGGEPFSDEDCYYLNCTPGHALDWGGGGGDPILDIDDRDGFGPENINIGAPEEGSYRVAVHYFDPKSEIPATDVLVKVYINGQLRAQHQRTLTLCGQYWEVAEIDWPSGEVAPTETLELVPYGDCDA